MGRKWPNASKVLIVLGVAFGIGAYLVVDGYLQRVRAAAPDAGPLLDVVVAATDAARGATVEDGMVRVTAIPSAYVPPGAVRDVGDAAGRVLLADIAAGEVLTRTRLSGRAVGPVASLVPQGFRAFAVTPSLPPGSIRPGDHVDVLATFAGGRPHTETVATDVEVLLVIDGGGAGAASQGLLDAGVSPESGVQTLMLLVLPYQAERLAYARAFGDLTVSISGGSDAQVDEWAPDA